MVHVGIVLVGMVLAGMLLGAAGVDAQTSPRERTSGLGTVETIAGPGYCEGQATRNEFSTGVGALSVHVSGALHFDSGGPSEGLLTKVDSSGVVSEVRTRPRNTPTSDLGPTGLPAGAQASGRLAADPSGEAMVATGRGVKLAGSEVEITGEPLLEDPAPGPESSGDGGDAKDARFRQVRAIASDPSGNLYVADALDLKLGQVRIRFVNRSTAAKVFYPGTAQERTVMPGRIDTVTGGDGRMEPGDGVPASRALLAGAGVSMALAGDRLYVGTSSGPGVDTPSTVRVVNIGASELVAHTVRVAPGAVATVAGGRGTGLGGDGNLARDGLFSTIGGITVDDRGNLYVADEGNHRIRWINEAGIINTFAGTLAPGAAGGGFNGNDRPAGTARLDRPVDVDAGPNNQIFISDRGNGQVRYVDGAGTIRAARGNGLHVSWDCERLSGGDEDEPDAGALDGVVVDVDGSVYLTVNALDQVKRVDSAGEITTAVGLGPTAKEAACRREHGDGSPGEQCPGPAEGSRARLVHLDRPGALALRPGMRGGLYIFEGGPRRVRFANLSDRAVKVHGVTVQAGTVRTVAGNGSQGFEGDGGKAVDAQLSNVGALVADTGGNLFIGDNSPTPPDFFRPGDLFTGGESRVRKVDAQGTITTVVSASLQRSDQTSPAPSALPPCCGAITGLALAPGGGLYVADAGEYAIWAANPGPRPAPVRGLLLDPGGAVPIAGNRNSGFEGDGEPATKARIAPQGVAVGSDGSIYVAQIVGSPTLRAIPGTEVFEGGRLVRAAPQLDEDGNPRVFGDLSHTIDHSVRKVSPDGIITTLMGGSNPYFNGDALAGRATNVWLPNALAIDRCGNLLVVDHGNDRLRRLRLVASCEEAASGPVDAGPRRSLLKPSLTTLTIATAALSVVGLVRRRRR